MLIYAHVTKLYSLNKLDHSEVNAANNTDTERERDAQIYAAFINRKLNLHKLGFVTGGTRANNLELVERPSWPCSAPTHTHNYEWMYANIHHQLGSGANVGAVEHANRPDREGTGSFDSEH